VGFCSPDANLLFLESPTGVGFSYSNDQDENHFGGDTRTGNSIHSVALETVSQPNISGVIQKI
jgi:hypothetical protein